MATKRADVISVKELSTAVERAVKLASERHQIKPEPANLLLNWEIVGRILREVEDMNAAFKFATEVTKNVKVQGVKGEPACLKIGRDILVGFIERASLPKQINL